MEVFSELLSTFGSFFQKEHLRMISALITSPWGEGHLKKVLAESDDELPPFARLALAFGDVSVKELVTEPEKPVNKAILCKYRLNIVQKACPTVGNEPKAPINA